MLLAVILYLYLVRGDLLLRLLFRVAVASRCVCLFFSTSEWRRLHSIVRDGVAEMDPQINRSTQNETDRS